MSISVLRARLRVKRLQKGLKSSLNRIYVTYSMTARDVWHIHALGPRDMYMPYITHCHAISITYTYMYMNHIPIRMYVPCMTVLKPGPNKRQILYTRRGYLSQSRNTCRGSNYRRVPLTPTHHVELISHTPRINFVYC